MSDIYQLKITLGKYKPSIWRRVNVDPDMSFRKLHYLIQILFAWSNTHLHKFETIPPKLTKAQLDAYYLDRMNFRQPSVDIVRPRRVDESKSIKDYLTKPKEMLKYEYDFGSPWVHWIEFEGTVTRENDMTYPYCVTGRCMALKEHPDEYEDPHFYETEMDKETINKNICAKKNRFTLPDRAPFNPYDESFSECEEDPLSGAEEEAFSDTEEEETSDLSEEED